MTPPIHSLQAIYAMAGPSVRAVLDERAAQIDKHRYTLEHDQAHQPEELASAAAAYLNTAIDQLGGKEHPVSEVPEEWPFDAGWKPGTPARNLVKALALGLAALDRMDNAPRDSCEAAFEVTELGVAAMAATAATASTIAGQDAPADPPEGDGSGHWNCGNGWLRAERTLRLVEHVRANRTDDIEHLDGLVHEAGPKQARQWLDSQDEVPF